MPSRSCCQHILCCVCVCLCAPVVQVSAAQHATLNAWRPHFPANTGGLKWLSKRVMLQNGTEDANATSVGSATAAATSSPTIEILQAADVTFRLTGSDASPFSNTTATVFQQALQTIFSNYSYADFQFESSMVKRSLHTASGFRTCTAEPRFAPCLQ